MEQTPAVNQAAPAIKKGASTGLIILLILVLIGGGVGLFFVLKPKNDTKKEPKNPEEPSGAKGRDNVSSQNPGLTADQIAFLFGDSSGGFNNGTSGGQTPPTPPTPPTPIYIYSNQGQEFVREKMEHFQSRDDIMNIIRAKYNTGLSLMGTSSDEQTAIDQLFGQLNNMDWSADPDHRYLKFPIYGTKEQLGAKYREDLQRFVDAGWEGFNLSRRRDGNARWWLPNIGLNLMVGTTSSWTPNPDDVWFSNSSSRSHIDFFKRFNSFWVSDQQLVECVDKNNRNITVHPYNYPDATGAYCGGKQFSFAEKWLSEIDRLDKVTEWEAIRALTASIEDGGDGVWMTYLNPDTGTEEAKHTDPSDQSTTTDSSIINA